MDQYIYLIGGLVFTSIVAVGCLFRKDLIPLAIGTGLLTIPASLSEIIISRDYWHPPVLVGTSTLSLEDFVFNFGVIAFVAIMYPVLSRQTFSAKGKYPTQRKLYALFVAIALVSLGILSVWLGVNSVVLLTVLFIVYSTVMWRLRPDLIKPSLLFALGGTAFMIVLYVIFFDILTPHWWENYWLLANTRLGVTILGHIPVTEVSWYFAWFLFGSMSHPFVGGREFVAYEPKHAKRQLA